MLPITGLTGGEPPYEATHALEQLRDLMDLIEIPFKGRVVTYPACHYVDAGGGTDMLDKLCTAIRTIGFRHIIVVTVSSELSPHSGADLWISPGEDGLLPEAGSVSNAVQALWNGLGA